MQVGGRNLVSAPMAAWLTLQRSTWRLCNLLAIDEALVNSAVLSGGMQRLGACWFFSYFCCASLLYAVL